MSVVAEARDGSAALHECDASREAVSLGEPLAVMGGGVADCMHFLLAATSRKNALVGALGGVTIVGGV